MLAVYEGDLVMTQKEKFGLIIVGLIVAVGVFGPGRRSGATSGLKSQTTSSPPAATESGTLSENKLPVEPASPKQLSMIREVLERGFTIPEAYAVRSQSHKQGYYVGGKIYGPGVQDGAPSVWLISGEKDDPGIILSVNAMAAEFSAPMLASKTKAGGSVTDPETEAVLAHIR
jgi:hypothetical protein